MPQKAWKFCLILLGSGARAPSHVRAPDTRAPQMLAPLHVSFIPQNIWWHVRRVAS